MEYKIVDKEPIEGFRRVMSNNMYGFIDNNDQIICDIIYDEISFFHPTSIEYDRIPVKKNGKCGFIDRKGQLIITTRFDDDCFMLLTHFSKNNKFIQVVFQGKACIIDRMGNILTHKFEPNNSRGIFCDRFAILQKYNGEKYVGTLIYDLIEECIPQFWIKITGSYTYVLIPDAEIDDGFIKVLTSNSNYYINEKGEIIKTEKVSLASKIGRNLAMNIIKLQKK